MHVVHYVAATFIIIHLATVAIADLSSCIQTTYLFGSIDRFTDYSLLKSDECPRNIKVWRNQTTDLSYCFSTNNTSSLWNFFASVCLVDTVKSFVVRLVV